MQAAMPILVPDRAFHLTGIEPRALQSTADSGRMKTRLVCPECGCWICGQAASNYRLRRIRCGTLDYTSWVQPTVHYWTRSKQAWLRLPEGDQTYETQPGL